MPEIHRTGYALHSGDREVELAIKAMEIGEPRRTYTVEPLEDPVPRELPEEAPEHERPADAPAEPEQVPGPTR